MIDLYELEKDVTRQKENLIGRNGVDKPKTQSRNIKMYFETLAYARQAYEKPTQEVETPIVIPIRQPKPRRALEFKLAPAA